MRDYFGESGICSFWQAGCGILSKLKAGCGMKNRKSHVTDVKRRATTLTRRDQNKHPEWNGMAGSSQKQWLDAGLKNTIYTRYLLLFLNSYILRQPKQFCLLTFFNFASDRIVTRRSAFCPRSLGRLSRSRAVIMIWLKESRTVNTLLQFTVS